jgi:protein-disulfide isomerase
MTDEQSSEGSMEPSDGVDQGGFGEPSSAVSDPTTPNTPTTHTAADVGLPEPVSPFAWAADSGSAPVARKSGSGPRVAVLGVILAAVIGIAFYGLGQSRSGPQADASAKTPSRIGDAASPEPWGVRYNDAPGKPVLAIWEDFQCPYCRDLEAMNGAAIISMADAGDITLVWRPTVFLDESAASLSGPNPKSSTRATMAWGCAIDAGKAAEFHAALFATQAVREGDGWSDQQLLDLASAVGITGDAHTTFDKCYTDKTYQSWVTNSYAAFDAEGVTGTPAGFLDGTELTSSQLSDPATLKQLVGAAGGVTA